VSESVIAFAPGRVNLIGEHTDYNEGLALPFAIGEGVTVRATPASDGRIRAVAADLGSRDEFALGDRARVRGWKAFVRGAVAELQDTGLAVAGARLEIRGTVPRGSGLSSSAALEVALCMALLAVGGLPVPDRMDLARICSRIENDWVGARTGLLDQLACLYGAPGEAALIDFRGPAVRRVPLELGAWRLVTLASGERRSHAASGYNERRAECERACRLLGVESLRDCTLASAAGLAGPLARRVRHVVSESQRVLAAVSALARGDLPALGALLNSSHLSLRDDYEVSTPAVEATRTRLLEAGACGARIIGGGFGGHVLGLLAPGVPVPPDALSVTPAGPGASVHVE
jgi:galactokinase